MTVTPEKPDRCPDCDRVTCPRVALARQGMPQKVRAILESLLEAPRLPSPWEREAITAYNRTATDAEEDCRAATPDWKDRALNVRAYLDSLSAGDDVSAWAIEDILDGGDGR